MTDDIVWDKSKGEIRIQGQRTAAIDVQALCDHLNSLVGFEVAEVIMNQHEVRQGREDAVRLRKINPEVTTRELVEKVRESELLQGVGVFSATLSDDPKGPISLEVSNPVVKANVGAAKSFLFSYWSGALSEILGRSLDVRQVTYDEKNNVLRCQLVERSVK